MKIMIRLFVLALLASPAATRAALPEPYNLLYGAIEMDGHWVTAADTNVTVEARRLPTGAAIASYRMGSQSSATNFYALKVRLETPAPDNIMKAANEGTLLYITVLRGASVKNQLEYEMGPRGSVMRLDFGNIDSDGDGLPDGWEQAYLLTLQYGANDDPDGDGVCNREEYRLGTNPGRMDARHPADLDLDWNISVPELAAYYNAWKKGFTWTVAPTNILLEYVTRATYIWEQGGHYQQDTNVASAAPLWWVPTPAAPAGDPTGSDLAGDGPLLDGGGDVPLSVITLGSVIYQAGQPLTLTNHVSVTPGLRTYAVEQFLPPGWTIVAVGNGVWDSTNNKAKWGPFFDRANRDLLVTVVPPAGSSGLLSVHGKASYDGHPTTVTGVNTLADPTSLSARMELKPNGNPKRWALEALPGSSYVLEYSADLQKWVPVSQSPADATGRVEFTDPESAVVPMRFYRARLLPP